MIQPVQPQRSMPRPRELVGYFEEWLLNEEDHTPRCLGVLHFPRELPPEQAGRPLGYAGLREFTMVEPFTLERGTGDKRRYAASVRRPVKVRTMLQMIEGREV